MIKRILIFLITFIYIFGPVFRPIGNWADTIFIISFLLSLYGIGIGKEGFPKNGSILFLLFVVMAYELLLIGNNKGSSIQYFIQTFLKPVRILITFFGGYILVKLISNLDKTSAFKNVLLFTYFSIFLHALIMTIQLYNIGFKDFIYDYTASSAIMPSYNYNFRMGGLSGGAGGAVLSVVQSLGLILFPFLIKNYKGVFKIGLLLMFFLIFYSVLISGRSGLWCFLFFGPISFYLSMENKNIASIFKYNIKLFFVIGVLVFSVSLFSFVEEGSDSFYALRRSLDTFLDYKKSGEFNDETINLLSNHLVLPDKLTEIIFGNGEHIVNRDSQRILKSDIGFIRNIWSYGVIFAALFWLPLFKLILKNKKSPLFVLLAMIMITFHFKESFLYVRMFLSIITLILFSEINFTKLKNI